MHSLRSSRFVILLLACSPCLAFAQSYGEDFEGLTLGPLDGQDRWRGWDSNNTAFSNVVSTHNATTLGTQSVQVAVGADTICDLDAVSGLPGLGYDSGQWILTCKVFIESGFQGSQYFLVMNDYNDFGPYEWNVQLQFDASSNRLRCNCGSGTTIDRPILFDAWAEIRCEYDLDNDNVDIHYNGQYLGSYPPTGGIFGASNYASAAIDAVDLYPDGPGAPNTSPVYYDDFGIVSGGITSTPFCFGDGGGSACPCGNSAGSGEGCANSGGAGGLLTAHGDNDVGGSQTYECANLIPTQPALLFSGDNAVNGGSGIPFGDGLRCVGQGVLRHGVRVPDASGDAAWTSPLLNENWGPGTTKHFQGWYRDPSGGPCGSGFNLTSGLTIAFNP
jgi:hypothetical protein